MLGNGGEVQLHFFFLESIACEDRGPITVAVACDLILSIAHSIAPKSVSAPSPLGLLENWDQHVTFAWKGES